MSKNRRRGVARRGERAGDRKAGVVKAELRKFGGRAGKHIVLTRGGLASSVKAERPPQRA